MVGSGGSIAEDTLGEELELQENFEAVQVEIARGLFIDDVERDAIDFLCLQALHRLAELDMLIFAPDHEYPSPFLFRDELLPYYPLSQDFSKELLRYTIDKKRKEFPEGTTKLVNINEANCYFFNGMADFLRRRIEWVRRVSSDRDESALEITLPQRLGGQPAAISSCLFTVSTNSPGLQVLWTPAYAHSNNYFGSPTTPVRAPLQAGSYRFGVIGGAYVRPQWALPVHTLPGVPSAHLPY
jgi:hypothetical protein